MMWAQKHRATAVLVFVSASVLVRAFLALPVSNRQPSKLLAKNKKQDKETIPTQYLYFSPNFQRHVVIEVAKKEAQVLKSFLWLDEAREAYPDAALLLTSSSRSRETKFIRVAGGGLHEETAYSSNSEIKQVATSGPPSGETLQKYKFVVTNLYESIISKIAPSGTGETAESAFLERFRPFDQHFVRERMLFMLSPRANKVEFRDEDWPKANYNGFGAGLTEAQALTAISVLPHLLSLDLLDANRRKPSLAIFYQELKVPFPLIDQASVELDFWLIGTSPVDVAVFAFLYSLGITWDQCRILLGAFPFLVSSGLDPSWELCQTGPVRSVLREDSLLYLRMRLQLTCSEVFAMIKTHSRLSSYTLENLKVHLDALQSKLFLKSRELRQLVLRSPSLLGVSLSKLDSRIDFLGGEANMTMPEIQQLILKQPALLQYNVETNLRPKLKYLSENLQIPPRSITKMLLSNPTILGRSLDRSIVPVVQGLSKAFGLPLAEIGAIFVQVPTLLGLNWETNMEPKVVFLQERLGLSQAQMQQLLRRTPRILVHSVERSLGPKLQILRDASNSNDSVSNTVLNNPSILLSSMDVLKQKIALSRRGNATIEDAFSPRGSGSTSNLRQKKPVMELSEKGEVIQRHPNIQVAAEAAGTSVTNMYSIINKKRIFNGKSYVYGSAEDLPIKPPELASAGESAEHLTIGHPKATSTGQPHSLSTSTLGHTRNKVNSSDKLAKDIKRHYIPEDDGRFRLLDALRKPVSVNPTHGLHLVMFVAGCSYPPEKAGAVRGLRRAGGLSVYFPQADGFAFGKALRSAADNVVSQIMPPKDDGTMFCEGMVCFGYPYVKASRNRCSLYACLNALRIVQELLMLERLKCPEMKDTTASIDIFTDSKYAWSLLNDTARVLQWGSNARKQDFVFDGDGTLSAANVDILYPLSRAYYRLVQQDFVPTKDGRSVPSLARQLNVSFHHKSEAGVRLEARLLNDKAKSITDYATRTAQWQYERIRVA